jgi:translation initiation factor IF-3
LGIKRRRYNRNRKDDLKYKFRTNERINAPKIRLVGEDFEKISEVAGYDVEQGIFNTKVAVKWARDLEMDLIEISPNADPPVCKILDFNKFLYQQKKKQKEIKAKTAKTVIKEIRFGPNTDEHDMAFKLNHAKKFLEDGAKVKAYVFFKGRSIVFKDRGELLLLNFIKDLAEYGAPEELPKLIGKRMTVMISPTKGKKN